MSTPTKIGFLGLGQMGNPMANNIVNAGFELHVYDPAGSAKLAPKGTIAHGLLADVVTKVETVFLSLPDGPITCSVVTEISNTVGCNVSVIVDLSTIGPKAAKDAGEIAAKSSIIYVDAPVSGGAAGAKAGSITVMWAGPNDEFERHQNVLNAFSKNQFHVGTIPGQGQTLKILNNFLSATAMAATSEAMLFGLSQGLEMETMLDVVNVSTGQNTASADKFPKRILTKTYDAGFKSALMAKDVKLYYENTKLANTPGNVGATINNIWSEHDATHPGSDFTRVYEFIRDKK
jgi:3-hydroxyisobutyrate dehydrogenase-like beta-hydroxyacid dehydrogenase